MGENKGAKALKRETNNGVVTAMTTTPQVIFTLQVPYKRVKVELNELPSSS